MEAVDQRLGLRIGFRIEPHAWRAVAGEKALEPQHVGIFRAPDDHRAADALVEHLGSAQDQRPHQPFAKLGFGHQQRPHAVGRKDQRLDRLARNRIAERRPAGKLRQLAEKRTRAEGKKVLAIAVGVVAVDVDLPAQHDAEADTDFAGLRQHLTGRKMADFSETPGAFDIGCIEVRQDLVAARFEDRGVGVGHADTFTNAQAAVYRAANLRFSPRSGYPDAAGDPIAHTH